MNITKWFALAVAIGMSAALVACEKKNEVEITIPPAHTATIDTSQVAAKLKVESVRAKREGNRFFVPATLTNLGTSPITRIDAEVTVVGPAFKNPVPQFLVGVFDPASAADPLAMTPDSALPIAPGETKEVFFGYWLMPPGRGTKIDLVVTSVE